jgi:hypothetical protein
MAVALILNPSSSAKTRKRRVPRTSVASITELTTAARHAYD